MACNNDYCEIEREENHAEVYPTIRELDGCYLRVKRNGAWENICFSDLTGAEREKVLENKDATYLIRLANHLANTLHAIGDAFDIQGE